MAVVEKRAYVAIVEKRILISREENKREREKGKGVIRVGGTMTWPSRENKHLMDWRTLLAVALADSLLQYSLFTCDGKLADLH